MSSIWIWPFELEEEIGKGGMGVVYRGRYVKNDRRVAVKLLPSSVADPVVLARFEREIQVLSQLKHPCIVECFGGTCEDKQRFYAMELVEGGSLDELLISCGGQLPWERVVEFGLQMCDGLQHAHEQGIVHRDVKPGNFLLTKSGRLKLSDFGLACVVAGNKLTADGRTVGTFNYMAPEQIRGTNEPLPTIDLYSLGCVFFKMMTGKPPFSGETVAELLNKHLSEQPARVSEFVPECPEGLDALVDQLLNKNSDDRPATADIVAQQLQMVSSVTRIGSPVRNKKKRTHSVSQRPSSSTPKRSPKKQQSVVKTTATQKSFKTIVTNLQQTILFKYIGILITILVVTGQTMLIVNDQRSVKAERLWVETFQDTENSLEARRTAAMALGKLGATNPSLVAVLEDGLTAQKVSLRVTTIQALGESGHSAKRVIPELMRLHKKSTQPSIRSAAGRSLEQIRNAPDLSGSSSWRTVIWWGIAILVMGGIVCFFLRALTN